eukprot:scaffold38512_cov39-Phaeocystis_antarctica.AAC.1
MGMCTARAMAHTTHAWAVWQAQGWAAPRAQQLGQARWRAGAVADKLSRLGVCQRAGAAATLPRGHGALAMGPGLQPCVSRLQFCTLAATLCAQPCNPYAPSPATIWVQ